MKDRNTQEKVWLSINLLACLGILPFSFIRWFNGDITLAIVDGIISISLFLIFAYTYFTRKFEFAKKSIALFLAMGVLTSIALKGHSQILWIHPTIIAMHYLMPLNTARNLNILLLLSMLIIITPNINIINLITVTSTASLTVIFSFLIFYSYRNKEKELSRLATVDPLTNAGNRRSLNTKLLEVISNQNREQCTDCLILIDLDRFKQINDQYGHIAGDQILISVCNLIKDHTRSLDYLYRYGGDEFIILPSHLDLLSAKNLAEKIRLVVEQHTFTNGIKLTLSIGVCEYKADDTPDSWISRTDKHLYNAKENGRNNVY